MNDELNKTQRRPEPEEVTDLRQPPDASATRGGRHRATRVRPSARPGVRPDIQGLRALAVGLVVAYHLFPHAVPGGYVGVDVFFVISGYLITGLLRRDYETSGRVRLGRFYARRARRLLPAALLVLTVTWLVSRLVLPVTQLPATAQQIRASALYVQNWTLASDAVDYFHAGDAASPVQHFWSLSVEEQFYLFWPLIFVVPLVLAAARRRVLTLVLATVAVAASFAYSVIETSANPAVAYFHTGTRIWELGLGGLLALCPQRLVRRLSTAGAPAWLGLAAILLAAFTVDDSTPFPGAIAAVPVGGAVLMLICGSGRARWGTIGLTGCWAAVAIGDLSYGIYLWHWPLIVLWQAYTRPGIGVLDGPAIVVASIVLAALTKRFVEDPIRTMPRLVRSTRWSLAIVALAIVPVLPVSVFLAGIPGRVTSHGDLRHPGAAALARTADAIPKAAPIPSLEDVADDVAVASNEQCMTFPDETGTKSCTFGDRTHPRLTVALVGDSHAAQWSSALNTIGKQQHWRVVVETRSSCPWTTATTVIGGHSHADTKCVDWGRQVRRDLLNTIKPDVVLVSDRLDNGVVGDDKADAHSSGVIGRGMVPYWQDMLDHRIAVVALHETPEPGRNVPDCLASGHSATSCSRRRSQALPTPTPLEVASEAMHQRVPMVDMNDYICDSRSCPAIVGNVIVYRDNSHLTATYAQTITPYLERALLKIAALAQPSA